MIGIDDSFNFALDRLLQCARDEGDLKLGLIVRKRRFSLVGE